MLVINCFADVNAKDEDGSTALMWAAQEGHTEAMEMLVATCVADVNAISKDGMTALMFAASGGHKAAWCGCACKR